MHRREKKRPSCKNLLHFCRCTLYLWLFSLQPDPALSAHSDTFALYHGGVRGCLAARNTTLYLSTSCDGDGQLWKWVSRNRLYNLGYSLCLGLKVGNLNGSDSDSPLSLFSCNFEPPRVRLSWSCSKFLENLNTYLPKPKPPTTNYNSSASLILHVRPPADGQQWKVFGDDQDLCAKTYRELYTIQGNSHGRPCYLPFQYEGQWFHSCTSVGRVDGHLWCATTHDYTNDQLWGFCPIKSADCETFWDTDFLMNSCYQFNLRGSLSWSEARTSCQQQGADLLSITKVEEQSYINGLLTGYNAVLWMGLNDLDLNGGWQWADSAPLKYLNWEADQPNHEEDQNCAVIRTESSGRWQNRDCSVSLPYICKKRPNATLDPFTTDSWADDGQYQCDIGWQNFQAGCYRLNSDKLDWSAAQKTCQKMDSSLVSIHTLPELEFITVHMKRDLEELWIGLHDTAMQMNFEWTDRTPVIFTFWHPFEPNNFLNTQEDCVTMWGPEGRWNDSPCNFSLPSICKKAAQKTEEQIKDHGCRLGWKWHSPACFWVGEELLTFNNARRACASKNSTLVVINNRFEQAFVNSLVFGRSEDHFWLGLHNENSTGPFHWVTGGKLTYTNWNRDEPASIKGGCVTMATGHATGLWEVKECVNVRSKYICRQDKDSPSPGPPKPHPTPSVSGSCPNDWKTSSNLRHCYKVFHAGELEKKLTWIQAHMFCQKHGADLASFGSPDEEAFIFQVLHEAFGDEEDHEQHWIWIGLSRRNSDSWTWSDGSAVSYQNFGRGPYSSARCGAANPADMNWIKTECDTELDWICKIPKGKVEVEPEVNEDSGLEWVYFEEAEYKLFEHRSTWEQAQRICSWFHASLASIHSNTERQFIASTVRKMSRIETDLWWIGLHTFENDGRYRWSDHSVLNYVYWGPGQPRPPTRDRKCVHISGSKGELADQKCHIDLPYVCKRVNVTGTLPPTPAPPLIPAGCPDGWSPFLHKCYKVFGQEEARRVSWSAAHLMCQAQSARLATVPSHIEQAFLVTLLPNSSFNLWVGLKADLQGQFKWADNRLLSYTNWAPGEPMDNSGRTKNLGNCVVMLHGSPHRSTGMWSSRSCEGEKHGFVCMRSKDPAITPGAIDPLPPALSGPLEFQGIQYRLLQKRLDWKGALEVCESVNGSLAAIREPKQHAYLTLLLNTLRKPAWIGLHNDGGRSYRWMGEEDVTFSDWQDGEPNQMVGCGHMTTDGKWTVSACDTKLDAAICEINTERTIDHRWTYTGRCLQKLGDWPWIPFRNYCYAFNLNQLRLQHEAVYTCKKVGAELLSVLDENENGFVWEHIQSYQEQANGAWLGMTFNPRGGGLQWQDSSVVEYTNWEQQDANLSMLSANSCFWVQSNTGLWKPGSCKNRTHGVICKRPRGLDSTVKSAEVDHLPALVLILLAVLVLIALVVGGVYLYRRRSSGSGGSYEGARYSRTNSTPSEEAEKNILVSDMELNEQGE